MKRKSPASEIASETRPVLPLPAQVTRHHLGTLEAPTALAVSMREWRESRRIPPSLLLTGIPGSSKRELAHWIAQWIFCSRTGFPRADGADDGLDHQINGDFGLFGEMAAAPALDETDSSAELGPCGHCIACEKALKGAWVDFSEILPEDEGGSLKVDQLRKLKTSLGFGAHEGAYKIILIPNAEHMTVQAANSLLKVLEEPPRGWLFFLTASDPTLVLPTILSRCQQLRLRPYAPAEVEAILIEENIEAKRAAVSARLSQGSLSKARSIASDETWRARQDLFEFLKAPESQLTALVDWAAAEPAHFELLIDQLELLALDLIIASIGASSGASSGVVGPAGASAPAAASLSARAWLNPDGKAALSAHFDRVTRKLGGAEGARRFWTERALRLARGRAEVMAPLNRKLLAQDLLLPWLSA